MTTINITNNAGPINNYFSTYIPTKACNTCRQIKQLTEFYKDKAKHDGYQTQCKTCTNNRQKEYDKTNTDAIAKYKKEYREQNKDAISERMKKYYTENKDKILKHTKKYKE